MEVKLKTGKIYIEGMQVKKQEGSKVNVPFKTSNLQIIELNLEGRKRIRGVVEKKVEAPKKIEEKLIEVKETKEVAK